MAAETSQTTPRKPEARARVSNGTALLLDADNRTVWVRRLRDIMALHIRDLGGDDAVSEAERSIVRRVATLTVEMEQLEATFATKGASAKALDLYNRIAGTSARLLDRLGLKRRSRDVTPDLSDYIEADL